MLPGVTCTALRRTYLQAKRDKWSTASGQDHAGADVVAWNTDHLRAAPESLRRSCELYWAARPGIGEVARLRSRNNITIFRATGFGAGGDDLFHARIDVVHCHGKEIETRRVAAGGWRSTYKGRKERAGHLNVLLEYHSGIHRTFEATLPGRQRARRYELCGTDGRRDLTAAVRILSLGRKTAKAHVVEGGAGDMIARPVKNFLDGVR